MTVDDQVHATPFRWKMDCIKSVLRNASGRGCAAAPDTWQRCGAPTTIALAAEQLGDPAVRQAACPDPSAAIS